MGHSEFVYSLMPRQEETYQADRRWLRQAAGRELCDHPYESEAPIPPPARRCQRIRPDWYPRPVNVRLLESTLTTCFPGIWWTGIPVIRADLLKDLKPFLDGFAIGNCYDSRGRLIPQYHTFYMPPWIVLRGVENSDYRRCAGCGAIWLNPRYQPRVYFLRRDFAEHHVRQNSVGCPYVTDLVASIIVERWFKEIKLIKLPLVDVPPDGIRLPGDPDWAALKQRR